MTEPENGDNVSPIGSASHSKSTSTLASASHPDLLLLCRGRDVKPENVVLQGGLSDGKVFLIDLGGVQVSKSSMQQAYS